MAYFVVCWHDICNIISKDNRKIKEGWVLEYKSFQQIITKVQNNNSIKKVAVAAAHDEHDLDAVFRANKDKLVEPILIGDKARIAKIIDKLQVQYDLNNVINVTDDSEAAETAVQLVRENKADFIMKGKLQTAELLKAVVNKERGLRT